MTSYYRIQLLPQPQTRYNKIYIHVEITTYTSKRWYYLISYRNHSFYYKVYKYSNNLKNAMKAADAKLPKIFEPLSKKETQKLTNLL